MKDISIDLGSWRTKVSVAGPDHAPAVVFLHSLGLDRHAFDAVREPLADRLRTISFDQRGHGVASARAEQISLPAMAGDVVAVLDALEVARAHVVGHSMGGAVAGLAAADHSDRVASLSLIATPFKGSAVLTGRAEAAERDGMAQQIGQTLERWFVDADRPQIGPQVAYARACLERMPVATWAAAWRALAGFAGFSVIGKRLPRTLCLAAELDPSTPPEIMRPIADACPARTVFSTIADASHMCTLERPAEVCNRLLTFWGDET